MGARVCKGPFVRLPGRTRSRGGRGLTSGRRRWSDERVRLGGWPPRSLEADTTPSQSQICDAHQAEDRLTLRPSAKSGGRNRGSRRSARMHTTRAHDRGRPSTRSSPTHNQSGHHVERDHGHDLEPGSLVLDIVVRHRRQGGHRTKEGWGGEGRGRGGEEGVWVETE